MSHFQCLLSGTVCGWLSTSTVGESESDTPQLPFNRHTLNKKSSSSDSNQSKCFHLYGSCRDNVEHFSTYIFTKWFYGKNVKYQVKFKKIIWATFTEYVVRWQKSVHRNESVKGQIILHFKVSTENILWKILCYCKENKLNVINRSDMKGIIVCSDVQSKHNSHDIYAPKTLKLMKCKEINVKLSQIKYPLIFVGSSNISCKEKSS